jgi:DNA-binding NarL/FixJ family response regulator
MCGRRYLSPRISERAIQVYIENVDLEHGSATDPLTEREREVLQLAAEGMSNPTIASKLFISTRTVETHRANLMRKLGLHGQADLIRYAIKARIITVS